ncbi:ABC transporter permease, partial [Amylibacter sp.]|nr:ABC transporter permease [Amylibacter sp.]
MEPLTTLEILGRIFTQFTPVWITMALTFGLSIAFKRKLGLYGRIFDSTVGMIGFALVTFWVFTAFYVGAFDMIATHDPLAQISGMKNKVPGTALRAPEEGQYAY